MDVQMEHSLSGVAFVIIFALGLLLIILLLLFIKRQIMRVAQKFPTDGPHAPIGHGAPKKLLEEIERRLSIVKYIKCEPLLMNPDNEHACEENITKYKHIYRMKAVDSLKTLEDELVRAFGQDRTCRRLPGQDIRAYLQGLRKENHPLVNCSSDLIEQYAYVYSCARHDPEPDFGKEHYDYMISLQNRIISTLVYRTPKIPPSSLAHRKGKSQTVTFRSHIDYNAADKMNLL